MQYINCNQSASLDTEIRAKRLEWFCKYCACGLFHAILLCNSFHKSDISSHSEYTYVNPGISALALAMMLNYNEEAPIVSNTYQCYLKVGALIHSLLLYCRFFLLKGSELEVYR
jgi:hypothetical protein